MGIVWFSEKKKKLIATITDTSITFNQACTTLIENAYSVMLGIDKKEQLILVRVLSKELATRGDFDIHEQYKIIIKSRSSKINNYEFINLVKKVITVDDFNLPKNYRVDYDDSSKTLIIDLKRGEKND